MEENQEVTITQTVEVNVNKKAVLARIEILTRQKEIVEAQLAKEQDKLALFE